MIADGKILYGNKGSYLVISNTILPPTYRDYTFIVFMSGNSKELYRIVKEHKSEFNSNVYFCKEIGDFFYNNSDEVEQGLYKVKENIICGL